MSTRKESVGRVRLITKLAEQLLKVLSVYRHTLSLEVLRFLLHFMDKLPPVVLHLYIGPLTAQLEWELQLERWRIHDCLTTAPLARAREYRRRHAMRASMDLE